MDDRIEYGVKSLGLTDPDVLARFALRSIQHKREQDRQLARDKATAADTPIFEVLRVILQATAIGLSVLQQGGTEVAAHVAAMGAPCNSPYSEKEGATVDRSALDEKDIRL